MKFTFNIGILLASALVLSSQAVYTKTTKLHEAAAKNDTTQIRRLLAREGIEGQGIVNIDEQDNRGRTALHIAANAGHYESVEALIDKGAQFTIKDEYCQTPFLASFLPQYDNEKRVPFKLDSRKRIWKLLMSLEGQNINAQSHIDVVTEKTNDGLTKVKSFGLTPTPLHLVLMFAELYESTNLVLNILDYLNDMKADFTATVFNKIAPIQLLSNYCTHGVRWAHITDALNIYGADIRADNNYGLTQDLAFCEGSVGSKYNIWIESWKFIDGTANNPPLTFKEAFGGSCVIL